MRRRARWRNRSSGSFSGSALPTARGSSARLRAKLWNGLSIASGKLHFGRKASAWRRR